MNLIDIPYCSVTAKPTNEPLSINDTHSWQNTDIAFNWVNTDYPYLHSHTNWELLILFRGTLTHQFNGRTYLIKEGDAWLIHPSDKHFLLRNDNKELLHVSFGIKNEYLSNLLSTVHEGLYNELMNETEPLTFKITDHELNMLASKLAGIQRYIPQEQEKNLVKTKICFQNILLTFLQKRINFQTSFPAWLESLLGELNTMHNFSRSPEELASLTPYSYSRMSALFKQHVGEPISQYLNKRRMSHAANLLANTDKTILSIALDCGYESLSSFNHRFTAYFGESPSAYRKTQKKNMLPNLIQTKKGKTKK